MLTLRSIPLVDHHCRRFAPATSEIDPLLFRKSLMGTDDLKVLSDHLPYTIVYRWVLRNAARVLGCAATEEAVLAARSDWDFGEYARTLFADVGYEGFFVETDSCDDGTICPDEFADLSGYPQHPVLCLDTAAESLISGGAGFDELVERFSALVTGLRSHGYVGAQSTVAYRTGLGINRTARADAAEAYQSIASEVRATGRGRLSNKAVVDYLLWQVLPILDREEIPLQVYAGNGNILTDRGSGNPLHLREILERGRLRRLPVTIMHPYPFMREAGYLASVLPNVYLDVSVAIPLAVSSADRLIAEALELAPASKLLFASDAHSIPELFWAGATTFRLGLERALGRMVADSLVTPGEAEEWAWMILCKNALRLHQVRLEGVM